MRILLMICVALALAGCSGMDTSRGGTAMNDSTGINDTTGLNYMHPRSQAEAVLCEVMRSKEPYRPNECK